MAENLALAPGRIFPLWRDLTLELANIFDTHGVCYSVARVLATSAGLTVVVGLSGLRRTYYDIWVASPDGTIKQTRWDVDKASFDALLGHTEPVVQRKFSLPASELIRSELWQLPHQSVLAVPLPYRPDGETFTPAGILCLVDPGPACPVDRDNIVELATLITTFLDRAGLRQRSHQQAVEFATVHDISYSLTASLDLDQIFRQLSDTVRRTLNVQNLSIGLIEPASGDIIFANVLMGPLFSGRPPVRLKRGQGIAGWIAEHAQPLIVNDVFQDKRWYSKVDEDSGYRTHSILGVPLLVENRVIGVLEALNKQSGDFNENDLRLLEAISAPLAVAIENASLHTDVLTEKRRIETLFASMSEGLLTVNAEGIITAANESLLTLLRHESADLVGRPVAEVIQTKRGGLAAFLASIGDAGPEDYPQHACDLRQADGAYTPVLMSGAPVAGEEGVINELIITFSDLRQIREVERMRDDFFANIIHELRTPLATILMYARLLRQGRAGDDPEKADRFLGVIERESDRLQTMVRQMLQLAKLETSEFQRSREPVDLNEILAEILPPMADRATEKGLVFAQRVPGDLPRLVGDRDSIYLVFKNLVENAVKFTLSGTVRVDATVEGDMICVRVQDDGIGMPQESLPLLFRRFYRTQTAVERGIAGTGLGLYMSKECVERHNGTISVESASGEGTTFTVCLPHADDEV